jgi:hypothetical protein
MRCCAQIEEMIQTAVNLGGYYDSRSYYYQSIGDVVSATWAAGLSHHWYEAAEISNLADRNRRRQAAPTGRGPGAD